MRRIRKGDMVQIIAGNEFDRTKPKRGRVLRILDDRDRVVVEGVNMRWKHLRKSQQHPQGARVQRETPIHVSNVMPVDEESNAPTRVGYADVDGKKTRIARKTGKPLVVGQAKAAAKDKKADKKAAKGKKKAGKTSTGDSES